MTAADDYRRIERAIGYIEAHADKQPSLAEVASHLGLSEYHFQRLFRRWAGLTPKDFLQYVTLGRAKRLLTQSRSLLDASLEVGLSGTGRLHDLFTTIEAMTPGEYKRGAAGVTIRWGRHATPFGEALFACTERGLCHLAFIDGQGPQDALDDLTSRWPAAGWIEDPDVTGRYADEVTVRMAGGAARPLALLLKGTPFQTRVWEALLTIPEGAAMTYGDLAARIGTPGASRAVGTALAANPIGYLIPCHRVIQATGAIGQYRWGAQRKQALLAVEGGRQAARSAG